MSITNGGYDTLNEATPAAPTTTAEAGSGGGNMDVWSTSRSNQINSLMTGADYQDNTSFGLPAGVSPATYENQVPDAELVLETPAGQQAAGDGGGNMDIWELSREDQLSSFLGFGPELTANDAIFEIPAGVGPGTYDNVLMDAEISLEQPAVDSATGGGGLMDVWDGTRSEQVTSLLNAAPGGFENHSAYPIPAAVSTGSYDNSLTDAEKSLIAPKAGVKIGRNVADSINFSGMIWLVDDITDPDNATKLGIGGSTVLIVGLDGFEVTQTAQYDGSYSASIPREKDTTEYTLIAHNPFFGETKVSTTVSEGSLTAVIDVYYEVPSVGLEAGQGVRIV